MTIILLLIFYVCFFFMIGIHVRLVCKCSRFRRQRDILYKHTCQDYGLYEALPLEYCKVMDELQDEKVPWEPRERIS